MMWKFVMATVRADKVSIQEEYEDALEGKKDLDKKMKIRSYQSSIVPLWERLNLVWSKVQNAWSFPKVNTS